MKIRAWGIAPSPKTQNKEDPMKRLPSIILAILLVIFSGCAERKEPVTVMERDEIIIALLDTGISTEAIKTECVLAGWNYVANSADTEDRVNHGTAVASVILGCESAGVVGMAPEARIVPLVIADKVDGSVITVTAEQLADILRESVDKYGASVINVSFGFKTDNEKLRDTVEYVQKRGALVIAAAGNSGDDSLYYPAAYDGVISVGSHDKELRISDFTQQNVTVDILAPGEDIWLASRNGKTYGARGTSYATGFVTAAVYNAWKNAPALSAEEVVASIYANASAVDGYRILNTEK